MIVMTTIRWIACTLLATLFLLLALTHGWIAWRVWVRRQNAPSAIPLLGGLSGMLSLLICPLDQAHRCLWLTLLPLLLDYGCIPVLVLAAIWPLVHRERRNTP